MRSFLRSLACAAAFCVAVSAPLFAQQAGNITLGFPGGVGPTDIPAILALEELKSQGWKASHIEFDSPDIQTQALLNGNINVASMGPATVFAANLAGADLRMVANNNRIDFIVLARSDINACADLNGKLVAYHSTGSTTTAHLHRWFADNCPQAKPNFMVLSGSANRTAALLNGQIAGTIVRLEDWIAATGGKDERARILAALAEDQSALLTQTIVVSNRRLQADRLQVKAFIDALYSQFEKVNADPAAYARVALPHLNGATLEAITGVYEALVAQGLFPVERGFSRDDVAATISFYEQAGRAKAGALTPDTVADFSIFSE